MEKNVIFRGVHEEEYEDKGDVKTQIIKAIANTMTGEDFAEKKKQQLARHRLTQLIELVNITHYESGLLKSNF